MLGKQDRVKLTRIALGSQADRDRIATFKSLEAALGYPIPVWKFHSVFPSSLNQTGGKSKWKFKNPIFL